MSKKSAKPSKKKASSSSTSRAKSSTSKKKTTSPTWDWLDLSLLNSKDISLTTIGESLSLWSRVTPTSTYEFSLCGTTTSGKEVQCGIRIGPKGLEYRGPSDDAYQKIG